MKRNDMEKRWFCVESTHINKLNAPSIIAACDAFIFPVIRREGLGKVMLEAMAQGVPPVVTSAGGACELVLHNHSGLIIPPGNPKALADAIIFLYENPYSTFLKL